MAMPVVPFLEGGGTEIGAYTLRVTSRFSCNSEDKILQNGGVRADEVPGLFMKPGFFSVRNTRASEWGATP